MKPSYLKLLESGELEQRALAAGSMLEPCTLCPEQCRVARLSGKKGRCRIGDHAVVADYSPHFGEEPPIRGTRGSGTVFFSGCNMHCVYCQNHEISQHASGTPVTPEILAFMFLMLQENGCHNINLVTPSHIVPMFLQGLVAAAKEGLSIPIVYNSGGYDSVEVLKLLDGIVDIYMPDFKYWDAATAYRLSGIKHYPDTARHALKEMYRQVGKLQLNKDGVAIKGLLVRHLVLPEDLAGTADVVKFLGEELGPGTWINIMEQYHPCWMAMEYPPLDRAATSEEYEKAVELARRAGLTICP